MKYLLVTRPFLSLAVVLVGILQWSSFFVSAFVPVAPSHHHRSSVARLTNPNPKLQPARFQQRLPTATTTTTTTTATTTTTRLQALSSIATLPLSQKIVWSCLLPTCLGFWRREYGVSYAYGIATALTSYWIVSTLGTTTSTVAWWHAGALMFYGIRLCLFLAFREITSQRMKQSVQRIEERAQARGKNRWSRTPFIASCAGLYFGLCAPLLITTQITTTTTLLLSSPPLPAKYIVQSLVGMTWFGFVVAALGDFNKSFVKARKGEDYLVTGGIYRLCRHPNYSGEIIGWTSNGLLALVAALVTKGAGIPPLALTGYLAASSLGALGLVWVLLQATSGLEKRQKETYGDSKEYQKWIETTWAGFQMPQVVESVLAAVSPEIEVVVTEEKGGSGI